MARYLDQIEVSAVETHSIIGTSADSTVACQRAVRRGRQSKVAPAPCFLAPTLKEPAHEDASYGGPCGHQRYLDLGIRHHHQDRRRGLTAGRSTATQEMRASFPAMGAGPSWFHGVVSGPWLEKTPRLPRPRDAIGGHYGGLRTSFTTGRLVVGLPVRMAGTKAATRFVFSEAAAWMDTLGVQSVRCCNTRCSHHTGSMSDGAGIKPGPLRQG